MFDDVAGYRIAEQVGGDSNSELYEAVVNDTGKRVLLRLFRQPLPRERYLSDLKWMFKAIGPLSQPDIVRIIGGGTTPTERPYLIMRYVPGRTLATYLANDNTSDLDLDTAHILQLVYRLTAILEVGLKHGVAHKDLQPDQIIIRPDGTPALLGLDLPQVLTAYADPIDAIHTRYWSPEQHQDKALDGRSNIYSLGMLLYDLLGGTAARQEDTADLPPLWELNSTLSAATFELVDKSLQREAWMRYQTYAELRNALRRALQAEGETTTPTLAATPVPTTASIERRIEETQTPVSTVFRPRWTYGLVLLLGIFMLGGLLFAQRLGSGGGENSDQAALPLDSVHTSTPPGANALTPQTTQANTPTPATMATTETPTSAVVQDATPTDNNSTSAASPGTTTPAPSSTVAPSETPSPTPTPTATALTPEATPTLLPTATQEPDTPTSSPSPSPTPTETPTPDTPTPTTEPPTATSPPPPPPTSEPPTATSPPPPTSPPPTPTSPPPTATSPPPSATPPPPTPTAPLPTAEPATPTPGPPTATPPAPIAALQHRNNHLCESSAAPGCDGIGSLLRTHTFQV